MRIRFLVVAGITALATLAVPSAAEAAARVSVTNEFGKAQADPTYATELTLKGRGFQAIKNGHGGIYVFFGTVNGRWQPSKGGVTGKNYLYVPDAESQDNQGYQKFIAFQGSDTESAAHGVIKADGSWSTTIKVPGATFRAVDRDGGVASVDCRAVRCGIITIGAHGVKNANNETFTPISFTDLYAGRPSSTSSASSAPTTTTSTGAAPQSPAAAAPSVPSPSAAAGTAKATASIDPDTAVVGRVLTFSGTGFRPGEQVVASFDQGRAAVGPLAAGTAGDVAGVLQLPPDVRPGTHTLRITGASSGSKIDLNFPVRTNDAAASVPQDDATDGSADRAAWAFLTVAALALIGATLFAWRRLRTRRRVAAAPTSTSTEAPDRGPAHAS